MPPISCTSKCRICTLRQPASRTTAKASGKISSSAARSAALIASASVMPSSLALMRVRNSSVLARSSSSESFWIPGSSALMVATAGVKRLMARSFAVPKTFVRALSKNTEHSSFKFKWLQSIELCTAQPAESEKSAVGSFQSPNQPVEIFAVPNAAQLPVEVLLGRVGTTPFILVSVFLLFNLCFDCEFQTGLVGRREEHEGRGNGFGSPGSDSNDTPVFFRISAHPSEEACAGVSQHQCDHQHDGIG